MTTLKVLALLFPSVLLTGGFVAYQTLGGARIIAQVSSLWPGAPAAKTTVRHEFFRGGDSMSFLRTNVGTYWIGETCAAGKVLEVRQRAVRVAPFDGTEAVWIVADDDPRPAYPAAAPQTVYAPAVAHVPPQAAPGVAYAPPASNPSGNAEWHPIPTPDIDADQRRMDQYLHSPTGVIKNREMLPGTNFTTSSRSSIPQAGRVEHYASPSSTGGNSRDGLHPQ